MTIDWTLVPLYVFGVITVVHSFSTFMLYRTLGQLSKDFHESVGRNRSIADICEQSLNRASDCIVGVNRIDDSLGSLASDVNDNVFRLMWQEDPQRGRRNRQ